LTKNGEEVHTAQQLQSVPGCQCFAILFNRVSSFDDISLSASYALNIESYIE